MCGAPKVATTTVVSTKRIRSFQKTMKSWTEESVTGVERKSRLEKIKNLQSVENVESGYSDLCTKEKHTKKQKQEPKPTGHRDHRQVRVTVAETVTVEVAIRMDHLRKDHLQVMAVPTTAVTVAEALDQVRQENNRKHQVKQQ